jgi:hypothetical protein
MMHRPAIAVAVLTAAALLVPAPAAARTATVKFYVGSLTTASPPDTVFERARIGAVVEEGMYARTGEESRAELVLDDGTVLRLQERTTVQLFNPDLPAPPGGTVVDHLHGVLFVETPAHAAGAEFQVRTPTSVAAVRGTAFQSQVFGTITNWAVLTGRVAVSSAEGLGEVFLDALQKTSVALGLPPDPPARVTLSERLDLEHTASGDDFTPPEEPAPDEEAGEEGETEEVGDAGASEGGWEPLDPAETGAESGGEAERAPAASPYAPGGAGYAGGFKIGSTIVNGQIVNQFGLRPELTFGKLGVALDLTLYVDADGNILDQYWDEPGDYLDKIYYVRWSTPDDPPYLRAGALEAVTMGYGLIMMDYANTIQYPNIIRVGGEGALEFDPLALKNVTGRWRLDWMFNNVRELGDPGVVGLRLSTPLLGLLNVGVSYVADGNQYAGLRDRDGDGVPDELDAFPDDRSFAKDTDGDGLPDGSTLELDADNDGRVDVADSTALAAFDDSDGDGIEDISQAGVNIPVGVPTLDPDPFNLAGNTPGVQIFGLDAGRSLLRTALADVDVYAQFAHVGGAGSGVTLPGVWARKGWWSAKVEYRMYGKEFLGSFFDRNYESERAVLTTDPATGQLIPVTKEERLAAITESTKGWFGAFRFNVFNLVVAETRFERMTTSGFENKGLWGDAQVGTSILQFVPKVNHASAFYQRRNVPEGEKLFDFQKSVSTIWGYRLGYEIAPGASLLWTMTETYEDKNGDGVIAGDGETVRLTTIETAIQF